MSKLKQNKIPMVLTEDNLLKVALEQGIIEEKFIIKNECVIK